METADKIRELREQTGMTRKDFAVHMGIPLYIPFQVNHLHGQTEPVPRRMRATLTETEPMLFYANYQATAC